MVRRVRADRERQPMAIHNRPDFHAFSALRWSDFRPATFGHNERRIDEAFFFIQRAVFTKLVGNVRQNQTQNLVAAPSLKASNGIWAFIALGPLGGFALVWVGFIAGAFPPAGWLHPVTFDPSV